jgi:hypothetical protein
MTTLDEDALLEDFILWAMEANNGVDPFPCSITDYRAWVAKYADWMSPMTEAEVQFLLEMTEAEVGLASAAVWARSLAEDMEALKVETYFGRTGLGWNNYANECDTRRLCAKQERKRSEATAS